MQRWSFRCFLLLILLTCVHSKEENHEPEATVYPRLLEPRSESDDKVVHLGDGNLVRLQKATVLHDTLAFHTFEDNKRVVRTVNSAELEADLYEDEATLASLVLQETVHGIVMDGLVNYSHIIKPVLEGERSETGQVAHRIYKVRNAEFDSKLTISDLQGLQDHAEVEARSELPTLYRPDIFVISDSVHNKDFKSLYYLVKYLVTFMNAVKLRYLSVENPRIIPRLVGVEQATWGYETYVRMYGEDMIAEYTLDALRDYVAAHWANYRGADVVMLVTGRSMISVQTGQIRKGVAGLAYTGGLCSRRRKFAESIDNAGSYSGVVHFAHELAHVLGASHDGADPVVYIPGNMGARHCLWGDGYIMSYDYKNLNQFRFSICSQQQFRVILLRVPKWCLEDTWNGTTLRKSRKFPGDRMSRNSFCRKESGYSYSKECSRRHGGQLCKIDCCPARDIYRRPAQRTEYWSLDGANCGEKLECYNGRCEKKRKK
ncbi:venom metalloproteinase antarease-like TtrivMP_A [Haemaphysalis longicornis]